MKKAVILGVTALTSAMLSGCVTTLPDHEIQYNDQKSRARNIAGLFDYRTSDAALPEGVDYSDSLVWDAVGNVNMLTIPRLDMGGFKFGDALGIGLGFTIAKSLFTPSAKENINGIFGYVPVSKAKTAVEARDLFIQQVTESFYKASKEANLPYKLSKMNGKTMKPLLGAEGRLGYIEWADKSKGCIPTKEAISYIHTCRIDLFAVTPKEPVLMPAYLGKGIMAWKINAIKGIKSVAHNDGDQDFDQFLKVYDVLPKYLPQYTYVYYSGNSNKKSEQTPPFVMEKNKINFFIKPQKKN